MSDIDQLAEDVQSGNRRALARAITLVESQRSDHRAQADALLERLAKSGREAIRIGLSGTPGVGKSTFIESFGLSRTAEGMKVAVLAIDPSSSRTGGSILGDKTRMERLSRDPRAFIRPSPNRAELGGVARRTREAIALCEAAGFDLILIETVGVGQSETVAADLSDVFVLLLAPAGGDELQGVKRGIMEIADLILVNKADGDLASAAKRTAADYRGALRLFRSKPGDLEGGPRVLTISAVEEAGLEAVWDAIQALVTHRKETGHWQEKRQGEARRWFEDEVRHGLLARLAADPAAREAVEVLGQSVEDGTRAPSSAAAEVLKLLSKKD